MIRDDELLAAGRFNKPHGIHGELSLTLDEGPEPEAGQCVVCRIDGINVPFFLDSVRPKSADTVLVRVEGISDERQAMMLAGKEVCMLRRDCDAGDGGDDEADGFYLEDMDGAEVHDREWGYLGRIESFDDRTANVLINIRRPGGALLSVPVADEFIDGYDPDARRLDMNLPEGILEL